MDECTFWDFYPEPARTAGETTFAEPAFVPKEPTVQETSIGEPVTSTIATTEIATPTKMAHDMLGSNELQDVTSEDIKRYNILQREIFKINMRYLGS